MTANEGFRLFTNSSYLEVPGGKGLKQKISICIFCTDAVTELEGCLSDYTGMADEFIIVNSGLDKTDPPIHQDRGMPIVSFLEDADCRKALASAVKRARGEWILILRSCETIPVDHKKKLLVLCDIEESSAYYLNTEKRTRANELSTYEWMGNLGKYSTPAVQTSSYISCLEIRLFRRNRFEYFRSADDDDIQPVLALDSASITITDIRLTYRPTLVFPGVAVTKRDHSEEDLKRFQGTYNEEIDKYKDFTFLERDAIGYSMVDRKDLPSLVSGLEMGFGNMDLLKFMVHSMVKDGAYEEAIEWADTIAKKMGEHIELWRLKGAAYFYMLKLSDAERCYLKALSFDARDSSILSNLTRISIISGKYDHARQWLNKEVDVRGTTPELEFIRTMINENQERTATLSVLILCRDEERYIGRALDSVKDIVDEIVIVDTGSQDRTIDIARAYGATIVRSEWEDDFGKARNNGLQQVTSDYVLCLDADEYLEIEIRMSLLVLKHILPLEKKIAIVLDIHTLTEEHGKNRELLPPISIERRTAIFPKLSSVCYSGRIFERIDNSLDQLNIKRIVASNAHISHNSDNVELRKTRKSSALEKSFSEIMSVSAVLEGVNYWIDIGNLDQGVKWFDRAVKDANGNKQYAKIISHLLRYFDQHGYINVNSSLFDELMSRYANSYKVMTICADLLYRAGEYNLASDYLKKLTVNKNQYHEESIDNEDLQLNLLNFAMVNLEAGDLILCNQALDALSLDREMVDAVQAVNFFCKLKQREIDQAISALDTWIKERNMPVKGNIDNFIDLLNIIADVAERMFKYGQTSAGKILVRASEHLASTISVKE